MKYVNAKEVLPEALLNQIMQYVDGKYLYIPKKDRTNTICRNETDYTKEMKIRNQNIYEHYLIGMSYSDISEMYHLSEKSIRRIVLKEKREMEGEKVKISEIIKKYGIEGEPKQIYLTAYDIEDKYIIKKYENPTELKRNMEMIKALAEENIPVQNILKTLNHKEYVRVENEYWMLTTKLKGSNIVDTCQCDDRWFFNMGIILAKLHKAFCKCENKINYWNNSLLGEMESWVFENICNAKPEYLSVDDVKESINNLREVYEGLPKGLIHRDVHLGNFLFYNNEFSGYIDFDLSQRNIRIFDLCYFVLGLLLDEEENRIDESVWFVRLKYLINGYDSELELTQIERSSISTVMENIELLFVAYFIAEEDVKAARDSAELYYFCKRNKEKIQQYVAK